MPFSHLCAACGQDLSRIAAPPDPHYGLPIVVCPRCRTACSRSRGEWVELYRKLLRVDAWVTALGVQIAGLLILLLINVQVLQSWSTGTALIAASSEDVLGPSFILNLIDPFVAITGVITGWWLSVTFVQWRFLIVWSCWLLLLAAIWANNYLMAFPVGSPWSELIARRTGPYGPSDPLRSAALMFLGMAGVIGLWMLVGWPMGMLTRHASTRIRRARFHWRRRAAKRCRRGR